MKHLVAIAAFGLSAISLFGSAAPNVGYHASSQSKVYHLAACAHAKKITKENLLIFATKEEAQKRNYRPCLVCKP